MKKTLIISILFISFFSCRTAKKEWVNENFTLKKTSVITEQDILYKITEQEKMIKESVLSELNETINSISEKNTTTETNSTTISGSVEAEQGKEKTVDANGLKITTNGFNVSFESKSTKELSKEFESKFHELSQQINHQREVNETLRDSISSINNKLSKHDEEIESIKNSKSKEVTSRSFSFGFVIVLFLVIALLLVVIFFKSKIPLIKNL